MIHGWCLGNHDFRDGLMGLVFCQVGAMLEKRIAESHASLERKFEHLAKQLLEPGATAPGRRCFTSVSYFTWLSWKIWRKMFDWHEYIRQSNEFPIPGEPSLKPIPGLCCKGRFSSGTACCEWLCRKPTCFETCWPVASRCQKLFHHHYWKSSKYIMW